MSQRPPAKHSSAPSLPPRSDSCPEDLLSQTAQRYFKNVSYTDDGQPPPESQATGEGQQQPSTLQNALGYLADRARPFLRTSITVESGSADAGNQEPSPLAKALDYVSLSVFAPEMLDSSSSGSSIGVTIVRPPSRSCLRSARSTVNVTAEQYGELSPRKPAPQPAGSTVRYRVRLVPSSDRQRDLPSGTTPSNASISAQPSTQSLPSQGGQDYYVYLPGMRSWGKLLSPSASCHNNSCCSECCRSRDPVDVYRTSSAKTNPYSGFGLQNPFGMSSLLPFWPLPQFPYYFYPPGAMVPSFQAWASGQQDTDSGTDGPGSDNCVQCQWEASQWPLAPDNAVHDFSTLVQVAPPGSRPAHKTLKSVTLADAPEKLVDTSAEPAQQGPDGAGQTAASVDPQSLAESQHVERDKELQRVPGPGSATVGPQAGAPNLPGLTGTPAAQESAPCELAQPPGPEGATVDPQEGMPGSTETPAAQGSMPPESAQPPTTHPEGPDTVPRADGEITGQSHPQDLAQVPPPSDTSALQNVTAVPVPEAQTMSQLPQTQQNSALPAPQLQGGMFGSETDPMAAVGAPEKNMPTATAAMKESPSRISTSSGDYETTSHSSAADSEKNVSDQTGQSEDIPYPDHPDHSDMQNQPEAETAQQDGDAAKPPMEEAINIEPAPDAENVAQPEQKEVPKPQTTMADLTPPSSNNGLIIGCSTAVIILIIVMVIYSLTSSSGESQPVAAAKSSLPATLLFEIEYFHNDTSVDVDDVDPGNVYPLDV